MKQVSQTVYRQLNENTSTGTAYFIELRIPSYKYDVPDTCFYLYAKCPSYPLKLVQKGYGPRDRDIYKLTEDAYYSAKAHNEYLEIFKMRKELFDSENGYSRWQWSVVCEGEKAESLYEKYA